MKLTPVLLLTISILSTNKSKERKEMIKARNKASIQSRNRSSMKQDLSNENIVYSFKDDRYPNSNAACNKVLYNNVTVTSEKDNVLNPPNPYGPTVIDVDVVLEKIRNLDLNLNTYDVRGTLSQVWCDPRLKFDPKLGKYQLTNDDAAVIVTSYAKMWFPEIRFRNGLAPRTSDNMRIYNFSDGTILYREAFTASLMSKFNLSKMPFDTQEIVLDIGSLTFDMDYVTIMEEEETVMFAKDFNMPEFEMKSVKQSLQMIKDPYTKKTFSVLRAVFVMDRYWVIYAMKIVLPLYLLIFITSLVFTYSNEELHNRIDIHLACILAAVAYQIVVEEKIPKYLFFNYLNAVVFSSICVMAYGIFISYILYKLHNYGYVDSARVLSDYMIIYYNSLYALIIIDLYIFYVFESYFGGFVSLSWTIFGIAYMMYLCLTESSNMEKASELEKPLMKE